MKWRHLTALVWMRWRMLVNQISRQSMISRVLSLIVLVVALLSSVATFVTTLAVAGWVLPTEVPDWFVFTVDGFVVVFLFAWFWGVVIELQQSEVLSANKFLHLPVSPRGILALNYLSSFFSLNLIIFLPSTLALAIVIALRYRGWMLLAPLLLIAFYFLVTAVTWQFRGWLAFLMADKRRRRTLMTIGTVIVVSVALFPQLLLNRFDPDRRGRGSAPTVEKRLEELDEELESGTIDDVEFQERSARLAEQRKKVRAEKLATLANWVRLGNKVVPFGWLPQGIESARNRNGWATVFCLAGMTMLGGLSILRSTQTTLRLLTGGSIGRSVRKQDDERPAIVSSTPVAWKPNWIEWRWWWLSDKQAAVATGTVRSLSRAPEAKLALFLPVLVMLFLGGTSAAGSKWNVSADYRAMLAAGICMFVMMGATQLIQNQFGFDRDGFRFYLLSPVTERDLLVGKNVSVAPLALLLGSIALCGVQIFSPMRMSHFFATVFQLGTMLMISSLVGNLLSIATPLGVKPGSMKAVNLKLGVVVLQLLMFGLAPLGMVPALAPLFAEMWLAKVPGWQDVPIYLLFAMAYFVAMIVIYRWIINWEADLLYSRRHKILETVTNLDN